MDSSTPETFVLAIGAPRDFIFLGQELLPILFSRVFSAVGEELYATEVYLNRTVPRVASLAAEDFARIALVLFVILVAIFRWIGSL